MNSWLAENSMLVVVALASTSSVLLLVAVVLFVLWRVANHRRARERQDRVGLERDLIDLELSLAEQTGRLRIIRELHEVAIHDVSLIVGQADGARYAGDSDPSAAVRAAAVIADRARNTLADLRRVMSVVRDGEAEFDAQPELRSASELFAIMRDAGLDVEFTETGTEFELKPGAELAVYRILQEGLENALKHGGEGTHVGVTFTWTDDGFSLKIDDDGARNSLRRAGHDPNLVSRQRGYDFDEDLSALTTVVSGATMTEMRERTELFGGVFTATTIPGVGFAITAAFPSLRYHNGIHGVNLTS